MNDRAPLATTDFPRKERRAIASRHSKTEASCGASGSFFLHTPAGFGGHPVLLSLRGSGNADLWRASGLRRTRERLRQMLAEFSPDAADTVAASSLG